jgi:hypothetical protein
MAIHQHQNAAVEIALVDAAGAEERIIAVIGDIKTRHTGQQIRERAIAVSFYVNGSDDRDGGRSVRDFLLILGSAHDGGNFNLHQ